MVEDTRPLETTRILVEESGSERGCSFSRNLVVNEDARSRGEMSRMLDWVGRPERSDSRAPTAGLCTLPSARVRQSARVAGTAGVGALLNARDGRVFVPRG